jgi:cytochrome c peroxidase
MTMTTKAWKCLRFLLGVSLAAGAISCGSNPSEDSALEQAATTTYTFSCPAPGFNAAVLAPVAGLLPFTPLTSLAAVPNPAFAIDPKTGARIVRDDLTPYVSDLNSAIQLGKAFFWEIQAGSDNKVACATCHFQAGADVRTRNQLNPSANGSFDVLPQNSTLTAASFPFVDPVLGIDRDDISGSQGVRAATFVGVSGTGVETTSPVVDPTFGTMRQTTGLNTPTVINAVFNHRNFFNGRAQPEFNGVNIWGNRDNTARAYTIIDTSGTIGTIDLHIGTASLASQAVGPPLNPVEMSANGRTFPDLGKKLLALKPLGLQAVSTGDSVLGSLAERKVKGLKTTYATMIQNAFQPQWWSSTKTVTIGSQSYTLMQANFSLFWGLAIMLYEGTLVSDQTPMDQYVASRTFDVANGTGALLSDNPALLDPVVNRLAAQGITIPLAAGGTRAVTRDDILLGIDLFEKPLPPPPSTPLSPVPPPESWRSYGLGCAFCHISAETTSASIRNLTIGLEVGDVAFKNAGMDLRMERMFMGARTPAPIPPQPPPPVPFGTDVVTYDAGTYAVNVIDINGTPVTPQPMKIQTYDVGWYDVGVRPAADNPGVGGLDAFGKPLSWTEYFLTVMTDPSAIKVPGGGLVCVDANGNPVSPPAAPTGSLFAGEVLNPANGLPILTGGLLRGEATDVQGSFKTLSLRNVEFDGPYFHSGGKSTLRQVIEFYDDGGDFGNATLSPLIRPLGLTEARVDALVAFLLALTDDRVMYQRAPFDHPELPVPAGQDSSGNDLVTTIPAVGSAGTTALTRYLSLNPFQP